MPTRSRLSLMPRACTLPANNRADARNGAASLDLAWVAAGRFDGFWETDLAIWDSAAGCLLVREAGGFVSDFRGRSNPICAESVLAANDGMHAKLLKLLAGAVKAG